ncbi:pyruvate, phosphate dikinase [Pelomyxa schiedti]|nr:pyruvate, phosphate dikinase [Pelomyxa schiedti]
MTTTTTTNLSGQARSAVRTSPYCVGLHASGDVQLVGGKAASLSLLIDAGLTVPPGYVITCPAYDLFKAKHPALTESALTMPITMATSSSSPASEPALTQTTVATSAAAPPPTSASFSSVSQLATTTSSSLQHSGTPPRSSHVHNVASCWPEELSHEIETQTTLLLEKWLTHKFTHTKPGAEISPAAAETLPLVAVRSSGVEEDSKQHAFAGMHDTILNVNPENLRENIIKCWDSASNERSSLYRLALGEGASSKDVKFAVIVQCMVHPVCSGVLFTVNPVNGSPDIVVNCAQGLGDAVVSGTVLPSQFSFDKQSLELKSHCGASTEHTALMPEAGWQQLLSQSVLLEKRLHSPQDIEWAWDGSTLWFLQSRPVTRAAMKPVSSQPDIFSCANTRESMGYALTPLTWTTFKQIIDTSMLELCTASGVSYNADRGFYAIKWGRTFQNVNVTHEMSEKFVGASWADTCKIFNIPDNVAKLASYPAVGYLKRMQGFWTVLSMMWSSSSFVLGVEQMVTDAKETLLDKYNNFNGEALSLEQAAQQLQEMIDNFVSIGVMYMNLTVHVSVYTSILGEVFRDPKTITVLLASLGGVWTAEQNQDLYSLAQTASQDLDVMHMINQNPLPPTWETDLNGTRFMTELRKFIRQYGFRGERELEVACPRWCEAPEIVVRLVSSIAQTLTRGEEDKASQRITQLIQMRQTAEQAALKSQSFLLRPLLTKVLARFQEMTRWRENSKCLVVLYIALCRKYLVRMAQLLFAKGVIENQGDLFYLSLEEVFNSLETGVEIPRLRASIEHNKLQVQHFENMVAPELFIGNTAFRIPSSAKRPLPEVLGPAIADSKEPTALKQLSGLAASIGFASAPACVVLSPYEGMSKLPVGHILAAAVVVANGGILSHGAITARELGIPAVVGVPGLMEEISDGDMLNVDGSAGTVVITEKSKTATTASSAPTLSSVASSAAAAATAAINTSSFSNECVVCLANQREVLFFPCKHIACCLKCSVTLTECPMCRAKIESVIQVYLA